MTMTRWVLWGACLLTWPAYAAAADGVVYLDVAGRVAEQSMRVEAALARDVDATFQDDSLDAFVERLRKEAGVPVWIDRGAIRDEGIPLDRPVAVALGRVPLRRLLEVVLEHRKLAAFNDEGVLHVTTAKQLDEIFTVVVHRIDDLLQGQAGHDVGNQLAAIVMGQTGAKWEPEDGAGGNLTILDIGQLLVVRQNAEGHAEVQRLLASLRVASGLPPRPAVGVVTEQEPLPPLVMPPIDPTVFERAREARRASEAEYARQLNGFYGAGNGFFAVPDSAPSAAASGPPAPLPPARSWRQPRRHD